MLNSVPLSARAWWWMPGLKALTVAGAEGYQGLSRVQGRHSLMPGLKAPFPYFGGKSRVAREVWARFGDVPNIEGYWSLVKQEVQEYVD